MEQLREPFAVDPAVGAALLDLVFKGAILDKVRLSPLRARLL